MPTIPGMRKELKREKRRKRRRERRRKERIKRRGRRDAARSVCDCRADYRQARRTRFYYRLLKSQLLFRMQYGSSMEGKDATNRFTFTQGHLFIKRHICSHAVMYATNARIQSCSHVCNQCTYGTNHEQDKDYNRLFIMYTHALNSSST